MYRDVVESSMCWLDLHQQRALVDDHARSGLLFGPVRMLRLMLRACIILTVKETSNIVAVEGRNIPTIIVQAPLTKCNFKVN